MQNASQASLAHAYNPSYSGGKDEEDHSLKPVWANSLRDSLLKKNHHNKGPMEWLKV
jgi:hypothetical protein